MPKDEFDFDDPMELSGVAFFTEEDTTDAMCECFIEEFMRMGYDAGQMLALFRSPQYLGPHMVLQKRGEPFIRDQIATVFTCWGRGVSSSGADAGEDAVAPAAAPRDSLSPQRGEGRGEGCDPPRRSSAPPTLDPQRTPRTLVHSPPHS